MMDGGDAYYVYGVYVNGELRYIGKGSKDRYKHAISGMSHVRKLNRDFYNGKQIVVKIFEDGLCEKDVADETEAYYISYAHQFKDLYNKAIPSLCDHRYGDEGIPLKGLMEFSSIPNQVKMDIKIDKGNMDIRDWSPELIEYEKAVKFRSTGSKEIEKYIREKYGIKVVVIMWDISKLNEAESIPNTLYIFDKGYKWFAHLKLEELFSHAHDKRLHNVVDKVIIANEEFK